MSKNEKKISKILLVICIILTIIYTIITIIPFIDFGKSILSILVDKEVDLVSKIICFFEGLLYLGVFVLPYYFIFRKAGNKKKNICYAIGTEIIVGLCSCFFIWVMGPAICAPNTGGRWEDITVEKDKTISTKNTDNDNNLLICKFINE